MNSLKMSIIVNIHAQQELLNKIYGMNSDINSLLDPGEELTEVHTEFHEYLLNHMEGGRIRALENINNYEKMLEKLK